MQKWDHYVVGNGVKFNILTLMAQKYQKVKPDPISPVTPFLMVSQIPNSATIN